MDGRRVMCSVGKYSGPLLAIDCVPTDRTGLAPKIGAYSASLTDLGINIGKVTKGYGFHPVWNARRPPPYTVGMLAPDTPQPTRRTFTVANGTTFALAKMDIWCITRSSPIEVDCSILGDNGKQLPGTYGFQVSRVGVDAYRVGPDARAHLLKIWREP
jgi:hypothetical protein